MTQVITEYNELKNILKTPFLQDKFDKTNELEFLDLDELEEKFITDKHYFNNIMNELPIWFDETNNIGFVPIPGIFDIEFFLLQKKRQTGIPNPRMALPFFFKKKEENTNEDNK